jgi:hypothetical protein
MRNIIWLVILTVMLVGIMSPTLANPQSPAPVSVQLMPQEMVEITGGETGCTITSDGSEVCLKCCLDLWVLEICVSVCVGV